MIEAIGNEQLGIHCPLCGSLGMRVFYEIADVPASCNLLWESRDEAINCPKGDIKLAFCQFCTLVTNIALKPKMNQYGQRYEDSLFYSNHFQNFAKELASNLVQRYDLHGKNIVEIGGGKVDFLSLLNELGSNRGLRFDPLHTKVEEKFLCVGNKADFVFSYCELEHMNYPRNFLVNLRRVLNYDSKTHFFFAVPNALKDFKEGNFTNIIYEHVSYFTIHSLFYLFSSCGFEVSEVSESKNEIFDSIYIDSMQRSRMVKPELKPEAGEIKYYINSFATKTINTIEKCGGRIKQLLNNGKRVFLWGAGSRGVTLLNILKDPRIEYAVDINPLKRGKYVPGTGQKIVEPKFLLDNQPDYIILANPVYRDEIRQIMTNLEINSEFILL